jgi:hypothetical protein
MLVGRLMRSKRSNGQPWLNLVAYALAIVANKSCSLQGRRGREGVCCNADI